MVNWKHVYRSRSEGGLGVLDLRDMNTAFLSKWWWKLLTGENFLWDKLILELHYTRMRPLLKGLRLSPIHSGGKVFWGLGGVFRCGMKYELGDRSSVELWRDIWRGSAALCSYFRSIFSFVVNKCSRVSECFGSKG